MLLIPFIPPDNTRGFLRKKRKIPVEKETSDIKWVKLEMSYHYLKGVRILSLSGPHFPAFGANTEIYGVNLRIQSECGKMRTR